MDRYYISGHLESEIVSVRHIASLSDHLAVMLCLTLDIGTFPLTNNGVSSYWKLNAAILKEENFLSSFRPFWTFLLTSKQDFDDVADWWDLRAIPEIRYFCF